MEKKSVKPILLTRAPSNHWQAQGYIANFVIHISSVSSFLPLTQLRQYQPSNVARELKQKLGVGGQGGGGVGGQVGAGEVGGGQGGPRDDFVLGQEPQGGVPSKEAAVKQSTASRLSVQIFILCFTL